MPPASVIALVIIALLYSFMNGAKDGANALATIITSRATPSWLAVTIVGLAEFAGPFIFGVAVARTIGVNIVDPGAITIIVVIAGLVSATLWNFATWLLTIPTSSSHAMIGGLVGAVLTSTHFDPSVLHAAGLIKTGAGLFLAPVVSLAAAYIVMSTAEFLLRSATPRVNWFFKRGQLVTTLGLALSHGANDAPKTMGIIVLGLVSARLLPAFAVPSWVILVSAGSVALGTVLGSRPMIRKIGTRFYRVRPFHAFNSQFTSGVVVLVASLLGSPVSTSQVVSSAIAGVGAAERLSKVRWGVMEEIVAGWLLTIPATAVTGGLVYWILHRWLGL